MEYYQKAKEQSTVKRSTAEETGERGLACTTKVFSAGCNSAPASSATGVPRDGGGAAGLESLLRGLRVPDDDIDQCKWGAANSLQSCSFLALLTAHSLPSLAPSDLEALQFNGYDDVQALREDATEGDLVDVCGLRLGHARRVLRVVKGPALVE